jgi:hypothetical protein
MFLLGLFILLNSLSNPRLAGLHVPDFLRLIASGMFFGLGFGMLFGGSKFLGD